MSSTFRMLAAAIAGAALVALAVIRQAPGDNRP
jgi:hypothetical protein